MPRFKNYETIVRELRKEGHSYDYIANVTGLSKNCLLYNCSSSGIMKINSKKRSKQQKKSRIPQRKIAEKCLNCNNLTYNPKFCCLKCAAKYNNANSINLIKCRKKKTKKCKTCNNLIYSSVTYCNECYSIHQWDEQKLSELIYLNHHKSSTFAKIRSRARAIGKHLGFCKCMKCGYDKHFEVSHIKGLAEFSLDTEYKVVNHPLNLIALCPNCHWEFDNGKITLQEIIDIRSNYK